MPRNDNTFKVMLQLKPEQFVQRFLPGATFIELLPTELPRESLYADALIRVRYRGREYIIHLEIQSESDQNMMGRILQYLGLAWNRNKTPVLPIIIYLFPVKVLPSPWQIDGPEHPINVLHVTIIKLWEQPVDEWLAAGLSGPLIFTALLKDATLGSYGQAAETLLQVPDLNERGNALNFLTLFAIRQFGRDPVIAYVKEHLMLDTFITESEWYQEILKRGTAEGIEKGVAVGMAQGVAQGVAQGERRMAQRALEGRFGTLSEDIIAALAGADEAALEAIVLHITTDSIEQVRERLGLVGQP